MKFSARGRSAGTTAGRAQLLSRVSDQWIRLATRCGAAVCLALALRCVWLWRCGVSGSGTAVCLALLRLVSVSICPVVRLPLGNYASRLLSGCVAASTSFVQSVQLPPFCSADLYKESECSGQSAVHPSTSNYIPEI
jgi:hypothetical protein